MNTPLSEDAIRERVFAVIARQAKVDPGVLRPEATLKDLGIASLEAIELIFDIEEEFDVTFPDGQASFDTGTVQSLLDAVRDTLASPSGDAEAGA